MCVGVSARVSMCVGASICVCVNVCVCMSMRVCRYVHVSMYVSMYVRQCVCQWVNLNRAKMDTISLIFLMRHNFSGSSDHGGLVVTDRIGVINLLLQS